MIIPQKDSFEHLFFAQSFKKLVILTSFIFLLFTVNYSLFAQDCELPEPFTSNTGANMTVMLTSPFVNSISVSNIDDAYIVALTDDGLVVGTVYFINPNGGSDLSSGQGAMAVWGDDTGTTEIDGALSNENISLQLVDGISLYDLSITAFSYVGNGMNAQTSPASPSLNCVTESDPNLQEVCIDPLSDNYFPTADPDSPLYNETVAENVIVNNDICIYSYGCTDPTAFNYNPNATEDNGSCYPVVYGCLDPTAFNFNDYDENGVANVITGINGVDVNTSNGTCIPVVEGCTNPFAYNFSALANTDDGTCAFLGCMDELADNYDPQANVPDYCQYLGCINPSADNYDPVANEDDGSCELAGCMSDWADNFDVNATSDDGSCELEACMSEWADNFDVNATSDDGSCYRLGCMSDWADNYDDLATNDDGSCELAGCMSAWADNYDANATSDNGSCFRFGCISSWADNYDELATDDDGSCYKDGCKSDWADNFDPLATSDDGSCYRNGCTADWADNYDNLATNDDGSCYKYGCMNSTANNFDSEATVDDGSCLFTGCMDELADNYDPQSNVPGYCQYLGCMNTSADNFDPQANEDDGSCLFTGCMNDDADNYDPQANVSGYCQFLGCTNLASLNYDPVANEDDGSCIAVVQSCSNPLAYNYNPNANIDDGSCLFDQSYADSVVNHFMYFVNQYDVVVSAYGMLEDEYEFADPSSYGQIQINLTPGWNTVGYNVIVPTDMVAQFEPIEDNIILVKNNTGFIYWPQFGFNGIGDLIPGQGYQIRIDLPNNVILPFHFVNTEARIAINPVVPDWAIEMEAEVHPNDIRTLVKVVNMLGQEVELKNVSRGTTLLYLYNDGTVEKKIH